ncbi:MAG: CAP domain-containing protein [Planctomycetota bacterium]
MRKKYIIRCEHIYSLLILVGVLCFLGVGSDTDLGDVERAIRDLAIKGYGYSPQLLDEQLHNISLMRTEEKYRYFTPVIKGFNPKKAQRMLVEKFSYIKKKAFEDYLAHRLPWQKGNNGGTSITHPGSFTTPPRAITIISAPTTTTTELPPAPPNVEKYPILQDESALAPVVNKINELRKRVQEELDKCKDGSCPGNKTPNAPWMGAVEELYKLWSLTIADAKNLSQALARAYDEASDKAEFESSLRETIRLKVSGNNYVKMKEVNDNIKNQSFMEQREQGATVEHNIWRAIMNLGPLTADEKKVIAARKHSEYMAGGGCSPLPICHDEKTEGRETPSARCTAEGTNCMGENVAYGTADPVRVTKMWLESAGHHLNIIGPSWRTIGIGFKEPSYWTTVFGR